MSQERNVTAGFVIVILLAACGGAPEDMIVGTWYEFGSTDSIAFFSDGTIKVTEGNSSMAGNYSFLDEKSMRIELGGLGALAGPMVIGYEFDGDILLLTGPDGSIDKFSQSEKEAMKELTDIRNQVESGLAAAAGPKMGISEYMQTDSRGRLPTSNSEAGLMEPEMYKSEIIASIELVRGQLIVTFSADAAKAIAGKSVLLLPSNRGGSTEWRCSSGNINREYLPEACR